MSNADGESIKSIEDADQTGEHIDYERREALTRLAKYTAPAMLAVLLSVAESRAQAPISGGSVD